jgi:hypothetical protein
MKVKKAAGSPGATGFRNCSNSATFEEDDTVYATHESYHVSKKLKDMVA